MACYGGPVMKREILLEHLEAAAAARSVKLSYEVMNASVGNGGLCRVKGELRVIIDRRASTQERVATLAESLSRLDSSRVVVAPQVREVLEYYMSANATRRAS